MTDEDGPLLGRGAVAGAVLFAIAVTGVSLGLMPPLAALATGVLALIMALVTLIDFRHFIIPDALSFPAVPLGFVANVAVFHGDDWLAGLTESALGTVLAAGSFFLLRALWFRLRGIEALGLGDVKLAAVAGAWLGPALLPQVCLAAALVGLAAAVILALWPGRRLSLADQLPFGSFIAPAVFLFWIWRVLAAASFG